MAEENADVNLHLGHARVLSLDQLSDLFAFFLRAATFDLLAKTLTSDRCTTYATSGNFAKEWSRERRR